MTETSDTQLESNLKSVDAAEALAVEAAAAVGVDEEAQLDFGLAVREAMVNAVVHGNRYDEAKRVRVVIERMSGAVRITIIDQGEGFDLSQVANPLDEGNLMRESGRGLLLIQTFVDEFAVKKSREGGAEVTMVKYGT